MIDSAILVFFSAICAFAGMSWGRRTWSIEELTIGEILATFATLGVVYFLPLAVLLPDSGNPIFETDKLWALLALNAFVLPATFAYVPRIVRHVRARPQRVLPR